MLDPSFTGDGDSTCEGVDDARCGAAGDGDDDDDAVSLADAGVTLAVVGVVATAPPVLAAAETESPCVVEPAAPLVVATDLELVAAVTALAGGGGGGGIGGGLPGVSTMCGAMKP